MVRKDTYFGTFLYQNRCPDMVAGMGFEPHDLRVMRTSVLVLFSSILKSKRQVFFVFADVLSMRGVGGGSTNLHILSSLSQRYFQTVPLLGDAVFFVSPLFPTSANFRKFSLFS